jgi:hypothetical protein
MICHKVYEFLMSILNSLMILHIDHSEIGAAQRCTWRHVRKVYIALLSAVSISCVFLLVLENRIKYEVNY